MEISIRHAEPTDFETLHQIYSGINAIRWNMRAPYPSLENHRKSLQPEEHKFKLVAIVDNNVVGYTEIETFPYPRMRHVCHIVTMAVRDDMIGQGIGSALMKANIDLADNYLQVTRFYLEVWSDNEPAINLYQKFGFEIEGTNVNFGFRDGKFADAYTMARIKK
jgi:putative acetyltransferase